MPASKPSSLPTTANGRVEKGMRKGTKSCVECRKRKVKCIFKDEKTTNCVTCVARGTKCIMQSGVRHQVHVAVSQAANPVTLEERVAQLEALIKSRASSDNAQPGHQSLTSNQGSPEGSEIRQRDTGGLGPPILNHQGPPNAHTDIPRNVDPIGSLFNNAIWRQKIPDQEHENGSSVLGTLDQESLSKSSRVCSELCKDLPPPRLLANIIDATGSWWNTWRAVGSWLRETMAQKNIYTLQEVVNWTLSSNEPPIAALGILCVATCLQQLDNQIHEDILRQLPRPPRELFQEYFDLVHRLVINYNGYSSSNAGIEVIMMTGKMCMNIGLLKMSWILLRQAISHAQLLGFHRPHLVSPDETDSHMAIRHETWFSLCERDLYTSLLLGLPYAVNWKTISPTMQGVQGTLRFFQYQMIRLSARIVDRNQLGLETSISDTKDIERDMDSVANELPQAFWDASTALRQCTINGAEYMEHLASQFWFFQANVVLHQPLMIQSLEDHQLLHHRNECLIACRETLKIYHLMRSGSMSAFSMVKVIDYQAFICSAILLLGLLGYGSLNPPPLPLTGHEDSEIVQSTLNILRKASVVSNNTIASQAVQGLDTLALLVDAGKTGICRTSNEQPSVPYVKITVPGSGVITISPGKLMANVSQSSQPTAIRPSPIFHLTHRAGQDTSRPIPQQVTEIDLFTPVQDVDISLMDLDWANMIGTDLEDEWAWLVDVNAGSIM